MASSKTLPHAITAGSPHSGDERTLVELTARVASHLAEARRAQILARFAAGDAVHSIRNLSVASQGIEQLANRLSLDTSGLLRIARTAERIRAHERVDLLALTDARGLPLTWSHLELLAAVPRRGVRMRLAILTLAGGLSVNQMRIAIRREIISRSSNDPPMFAGPNHADPSKSIAQDTAVGARPKG